MGEMTIKNAPDFLPGRFKVLAAKEGIEPEDLARRLVEMAVVRPKTPAKAGFESLDRLRFLTPGVLSSSVPILREIRD